LIDVDFATVTVSNVTATTTANLAIGTVFSSAAGSGSEVTLFNFDVDDYVIVLIEAMDVILMTTVDFGAVIMIIIFGGIISTGSGLAGEHVVFDDVIVGNIVMICV
jgi:hypothetical protein